MKALIAIISVLTILLLNTGAFSQTSSKTADAVKPSTVKQSSSQLSKPDANAAAANTADANNKEAIKKTAAVSSTKSDLADMTLEQALEVLRNSTKPPLKMVVLWGQLEKAGIERIKPVSMEGLSGAKLGTALRFVLDSASSENGQLDYWIKDGVIIVGLKASKPNDKVTQFYNVCDVTAAPSNPYGAMGGYNSFGNQMGGGAYGQNNYTGGAGRYGNMGGYPRGGAGYNQYGGGYGGGGLYGNYGTIGTGTSLGVGGYGVGYGGYPGGGYGMGGMGMGGIGMGGYGVARDPAETYLRQQQLKTLIQTTILPDTWNR